MKIYALAARQYRFATWLATGVRPQTSPPLELATFDYHAMDGADLVYVCAHGLGGQPFWYGDRLVSLASADQVRRAWIPGSIAYIAGCFGAGPMTDALLEAGADAVIADENVNWSGLFLPRGSNGLGKILVSLLRRGLAAGDALEVAKVQYLQRNHAARDYELVGSTHLYGDPAASIGRRPKPTARQSLDR